MKITMTDAELRDALTHGAPIPPGYRVTSVDFQKYSADFCTMTLERVETSAAPAVVPLTAAPLKAFEDLPPTLAPLEAA